MPTSALIVRSLSAQASLEPHTFTTSFTVGRSPDSDVQIVHPLVSRTHLLVTPTPTGWTVSCQGRNGMLVNGSVNREALITQGTRIQLGDASGPALGLTPVVSGTPSAPQAGPHPQVAGYRAAAPAPVQPPSGLAPTTAVAAHARPAPSTMGPPTSTASRISSGGPQAAPSPTSASSGAFPSSRHTLKSFRINSSGTIGRAPDNTLVLDDPLISKHHARIDVSANGMVITDLGSTNGIYVAGQRVSQVQVTQPVLVGLGSTFIALSPDGLCEVQVAGGAGGELVGKDLTFRVNNGNLTLLDGISFSLPGNELLAVVGPSGAGKSTLLKALTGEQKAQEGQVLFNGLDVYEHYPVMRNKIGVVPQSDVIHSALTVRKTLEYAAELRFAKDVTKAERRQRIAEVLEDLDLTAHVDKRVKKLSGGQRKRVSTAIELLTRPSLLFLDEPTSGLDPQLDRDVMDLLASLAHGTRPGDSGRTVVVVTHNENHIDRADKVLILAAGGKPVYYGSPREVLPYFRQRLNEIASQGRLLLNTPKGTLPDPPAVDGYADVYALIRNHTAELRQYMEATVPSTRRGGAPAAAAGPAVQERPPKQQSVFRQVSTLVRRQLRIVAADPSYLAFMLLLPIIMGLLTKAIEGSDGFAVPDYPEPTPENPTPTIIKYSSQALQLLVILITGAAFSGMSATIRDLIGERDVFLREKAVGLRSGAYLFSKTVILALISAVQTALMMGIALALNKGPSDAVILDGWPGVELAFCCWAVAFVSGLLGLAVSAMVSSSEQVMPVLVVSIMAQLVLSGGIIPISGRAVFEQLAWFMPSRWGYAMAASTLEMLAILPNRDDALWKHETAQWLTDYGLLSAIGLTCMVVCYIALARRGRR
ncbi:ATP-binding cassette domain-containing protein [uncultured Actinomyces sp.]|uniref:ATP-binding cassette domain-containing protein n=1 Tax=uncultured Actinomyces sp. TaxID=249061 RepID=UPI0028D7BF6F|nr:ATP-binding cassette domain-containing protein [uncultured Actinomyces sp.]